LRTKNELEPKIEIIVSDADLLIKQITYDLNNFENLDLSIFSEKESIYFDTIQSVKRKLEYYYTRILWKTFNINSHICYSIDRQPEIENGYISISHSNNIVIIGFSKKVALGVDVEFIKDKIERVKHKFLSSDDEKLISPFSLVNLTVVWSAKESFYKMMKISGLRFLDQIHVKITNNEGNAKVDVDDTSFSYNFQFIIKDTYVITYCLDQPQVKRS